MAQELKDYDIMDIEAMDDERLEKSSTGKIFLTRVYIKSEADAVLAEKDAEIAELKQKLESVQASMYADVVDTNMENRRLQRALWIARAAVAHATKYKYHRLSCKAEIDPQPHGWSCYINGEVYSTGKMNRKLEPHYWIELWEEVERKCRAKAEQYK